jgi:hypothetical protein
VTKVLQSRNVTAIERLNLSAGCRERVSGGREQMIAIIDYDAGNLKSVIEMLLRSCSS